MPRIVRRWRLTLVVAVIGLLVVPSMRSARAASGGLDSSFGNGGTVTTDFGGAGVATAVALQPDGKLVAVGAGAVGSDQLGFAVARYNDDGTLDQGFGPGGTVSTRFTDS